VHELTVADEAEGVGLRERKRRATSRSIQFAVLELAADRGLDQVTIDEVSRIANISPRTFFNYFPSKEAAMVGEDPLAVQPQLIDAFVDADPEIDIIDGLLELMQQIALRGTGDRQLHQLRRTVLRDYPELFMIRVTGMRSFEIQLAEGVERRLLALNDDAGAPDAAGDDLAARARLIAMIAITTMRHAFAFWAESHEGEAALSEKLVESFVMLRRVL
jgi:AcrR family transcriptional regulator